MVDELSLDAPEEQKEPQNNIQKNNPKKKKKTVKWVLISFLIFLLIASALFFIAVLRLNLNKINDDNSVYDISTTDDPYAGGENADVVIVEFGDFQCPYCFQVFPTVRELLNDYGDKIKFIYRDFPNMDIHPQSQKAAEASECAAEQGKFWEYHDKLFINQDNLGVGALKNYAAELGLDETEFNECLDSNRYYEEVQQDFASGILAGVDGTPTFFINNVKFEGAITLDNFQSIIDQLLVIFEQQNQ